MPPPGFINLTIDPDAEEDLENKSDNFTVLDMINQSIENKEIRDLCLTVNNKTGTVARYDDVKHLFKIYSYIYTVDYLAGNYGNKANITEARQCEKSDWQVSDSIKE